MMSLRRKAVAITAVASVPASDWQQLLEISTTTSVVSRRRP
ncbi:hypothetical protein ACFQJ7_06570 [Halovenus rubra]|uniref:Uncharacterized protein n=2 Tax=Halovenus rubra TaxID=869890 RepID=A0ACC7DZD9_9EURY|nr:hypothetical protein [Halovenus rubra]